MTVDAKLVAGALLLSLSACPDAASGALENQSLGRTTGFFAQLTPDNVLCELSGIGEVKLQVTMAFGPDKKAAHLSFPPLEQKAERIQAVGSFIYQGGESVFAAVEYERGQAIVDPRLGEESRASALEQRTSLFFPSVLHRVVVDPGHICETTIGGSSTGDCLDVAASTMEGARLWCGVAPNTPPKYSE